ncbi:MAG: hypothetical protein RR420_07700 [Anaerovoracaceae bacterium]
MKIEQKKIVESRYNKWQAKFVEEWMFTKPTFNIKIRRVIGYEL